MPALNYSQVADLYDSYVQMNFDFDFFLRESASSEQVLELTSGTGRVSLPLIEAGRNLTCVDSSAEMLAILSNKLKERGLRAEIHEKDICSFDLAREFDLIVIPFHAFAEIANPADQRRALAAIRRHLADSGRFICTLHNPALRRRTMDGKLRLRGECPRQNRNGRLLLSLIEEYDPTTHLASGKQFIELYDSKGVLESKRCVDLKFFMHERSEFEDLIRSTGFSTSRLLGDYSGSEFDEQTSPFMIWILEKSDL